MIIDAHLHVDDVPALGWKMEAELCIRRLDEAGIDAGIVMTITDWPEVNRDSMELVAEACDAFPGRLYAFARMHTWYWEEALVALEGAFREYDCFKGLKLHPVTTIDHPASEGTLRLIRKAAEYGAPTLFHCGDEPLTTPLAIAEAAVACPEATIILGHMGGYFHVEEAISVALRYPNMILETSAMPYPARIREAVEAVGAERVIYGSDGPVCSPRIEVEKVRLAGLEPESERKVLGENARSLIEAVR